MEPGPRPRERQRARRCRHHHRHVHQRQGDLSVTFAAGKQNVDVLAGSNKDEGTCFQFGGPTRAEQFLTQSRQKYGELADKFLKVYPAGSDAEVARRYREAPRTPRKLRTRSTIQPV